MVFRAGFSKTGNNAYLLNLTQSVLSLVKLNLTQSILNLTQSILNLTQSVLNLTRIPPVWSVTLHTNTPVTPHTNIRKVSQ